MGHKTLSDKLDQIQKEELGIHFDESLLWDDLSAQLGSKKTIFVEKRLLIAACITFLILFFPIVLLIDADHQQLALTQPINNEMVLPEATLATAPLAQDIRTIELANTIKRTRILSINKKKVTIALAEEVDLSTLNLQPISVAKQEKIERQLFADQDISIIQASLGTLSIENEKSVTLRAQLHTSSQPAQLNNQALKIKLFEVSNQ